MTEQQKAAAYDRIAEMFQQEQSSNNIGKQIGTLGKTFGLKGFKTAEIGEPVFELNDRHILVLESLDGKTSVTVPFYKGDLSVFYPVEIDVEVKYDDKHQTGELTKNMLTR